MEINSISEAREYFVEGQSIITETISPDTDNASLAILHAKSLLGSARISLLSGDVDQKDLYLHEARIALDAIEYTGLVEPRAQLMARTELLLLDGRFDEVPPLLEELRRQGTLDRDILTAMTLVNYGED